MRETPDLIQVPGWCQGSEESTGFWSPGPMASQSRQQRKLIQLVTNRTHLGKDGLGLLGLRCGDKNWIWIPLSYVLSRT